MSDKIGGKKIRGVTSTTKTDAVEKARSVAESASVGAVTGVKATQGVGAVKGAGGIASRGSTKAMSANERREFLRMIDEETERLVKTGLIPASKREIVQGAVKMTVQAGWEDDEDGEKKQ